MSERILVVDDEKEIADLLELSLKVEGFSVVKCNSAAQAQASIKNETLDLAILDIILPDADGYSLCQMIREKHTYPIIFLTSRIATIDKINGLGLGADDFVTKPFDPTEIVARVKAQLRRYKKYNSQNSDENILAASGIRLDLSAHRCWLEDKPLELTPTEYSILRILCMRKGVAVSSEDLFREIWNEEYFNKNTNPIAVHIRHLREKLGDDVSKPQIIKTVWGVGYKIDE